MSRRPMVGQPNPGRGGDGRRLMWSESPIPRVATRRVRMVGTTPLLLFPFSDGAGVHPVGFLHPEPPDSLYMTQYPSVTPEQGIAWVTMLVGYNAGSITLPSGWTEVAGGSFGGFVWSLATVSHLTWAGDQEFFFSDWDIDASIGLVTTWNFQSAVSTEFPYYEGDLPDFGWTLRATTPVTHSGVSSVAAASAPSSWLGRWHATLLTSSGGTYPYLTSDPDLRGGLSAWNTPLDRLFSMYRISASGFTAPSPDPITYTLLGTTGNALSLGLGWTP